MPPLRPLISRGFDSNFSKNHVETRSYSKIHLPLLLGTLGPQPSTRRPLPNPPRWNNIPLLPIPHVRLCKHYSLFFPHPPRTRLPTAKVVWLYVLQPVFTGDISWTCACSCVYASSYFYRWVVFGLLCDYVYKGCCTRGESVQGGEKQVALFLEKVFFSLFSHPCFYEIPINSNARF
jgi:hypothetical protein